MEVEVFYDGSTAMIRFPDGGVMRLSDAQRQVNPDMDFDDMTGLPLPSTPSAYDPAEAVDTRQPNRFGDVGERYGNEALQTARDLLLGDANLYDALPESMRGGMMEPINRTIMNAADIGVGGLMGLLGLGEKGVAYGSELIGRGTQSEGRLARDILGGADVAGVGPEIRALGALSNAATRSIAGTAAEVDDVARRFMADEAGSLRLGAELPAPRNEAEAMARQVLEMRAAGRAGDVTEEMRAAADPQYMFANTPLPMDEASRMARAREMGRRDEFHGTTTGSDMVAPDAFRGTGARQGIGFVTSDNPYVASSYADPNAGAVFPMLNVPLPANAPRIDVGGNVWSDISVDTPVTIGDRVVTARQLSAEPADVGGVLSTNQLSRGASFDYPGIEFSNIMDRSIHAPRPRTDDGMEILREFQRLASDPSNVTMRQDTRGMRSRFALFDPEFAHLRNLSAGVGGLGLLGLVGAQPGEQY
jgi:hypothetical protein